jgi:hypothetical protein
VSEAIDPLEKVIRPIVEGQIRGFLYEHPAVVSAVDWYKKRTDKVTTFTNSLSKRVVRDLLCDETRGRIEDALMERWELEKSGVEFEPAPVVTDVGMATDIVTYPDRGRPSAARPARVAVLPARAVPSALLLPQIEWGS